MAAQIPTVSLSEGTKMPVFGLGTWLSDPGEVGKAVKCAVEAGYPLIDCAERYGNQKEIGTALASMWKGGHKREDVFITSKLWNTRHDQPEESVKRTLSDLQLDYLDMYLIHFPEAFPRGAKEEDIMSGKKQPASITIKKTWEMMETLVDKGLVRAIGVSNFGIPDIKEVLGCRIKPAVNQIEVHPYNASVELVKFCQDNGIVVQAYSSIGNVHFLDNVDPDNPRRPNTKSLTPLLQHAIVKRLATQYGKTPGQILLRYGLDRDMTVIPKSVREERIRENMNIFDFKLEPNEVAELTALDCQFKIVDPGWRDWPKA
ncbi:aldo-keto reductase family 1 member B1-like [Oscarella lobularis]|uniref:aldo-keto reductase family 1 member B1-like n=1 Tax=Oscarella lobularis TaxID=121494 RepID=UPI0033140763